MFVSAKRCHLTGKGIRASFSTKASLDAKLNFVRFRLEGETGRASNDPVFVVGVYCDTEKIGESFGPSLKVAENRACQDALLRYFCLEEETALLRNLPGSTAAKDLRPFPIYDSPAPARNSPRLFKK